MFSRIAPWWRYHESDDAEYQKEPRSHYRQHVQEISEENLESFLCNQCDERTVPVTPFDLCDLENKVKSKTRMICDVSFLGEPSIKISASCDHY